MSTDVQTATARINDLDLPPGKYVVPEAVSTTARFVVHRLNENRDVKAIVTGKGATTGISKTTGAIHFADFVHSIQKCGACGSFTFPSATICHRCGSSRIEPQQDPWTPEQSGFHDPWRYMDYYTNESEHGETLLLDEAEYSIHKRRAMSGENVEMTKVWSALRYRNCISILTLPSTSMIDSLMMELGDLWMNAVTKGVFDVYHYFYNDFTQTVTPHQVVNEHGMQERFEFSDLTGQRKQYIDDRKESYTSEGIEIYEAEDVQSEVRDAELEHKIEICEKILSNTELSQSKIGECITKPGDDDETMTQQWVSTVNNGGLGPQTGDEYPIRG